MKNLFKSLLLISAVACMFASCQIEELQPQEPETFTLTVNATAEDAANAADTKTYIDGKQIYWDADNIQKMKVISLAEGATAATTTSSNVFNTTDEGKTGTFTFTVAGEQGKTTISAIYPSTASYDGKLNFQEYQLTVPATQTATADSYDPKAFLLLAKAEEIDLGVEKVWNAYYRRVTALNCLTLTGIDATASVSSVKITFPEGIYVAGGRYFNLETGVGSETFNYNPTNVITVNYTTPLTAVNGEYKIWFTTWGATVPANSEITVDVVTDKDEETEDATGIHTTSYKKTFKKTTGALEFKEGWLNNLSVQMVKSTSTQAKLDGTYLVLGNKSGKWYLMSNEVKEGYLVAIETSVSTDYDGLTCAEFYTEPSLENCVWTFRPLEKGYNIQNGSNYLKFNNAIKVELGTNATTIWGKQLDDNSYLLATINEGVLSDTTLYFNDQAPRFKPYTSTQDPIYIIPYVANTKPLISVSPKEYTVKCDETTLDIPYTMENFSGSVTLTATETTDASNIISNIAVASDKVTLTLVANSDEVEKTATITLSATGAEDVVITITQEAYEVADIYTWNLESGCLGAKNAEAHNITAGSPVLTWSLSTNPSTVSWSTEKGVQLGKAEVSYTMTTTASNLSVKEIIVNTSKAKSATVILSVYVNDVLVNTAATVVNDPADYTFTLSEAINNPNIKLDFNITGASGYIKSVRFK